MSSFTRASPTQAQVRLHWTAWRSVLLSVNCRRSCLSCCWCKGVEWPAKRCYVGLVAVGVQEQAEDILVPFLLRNCLTLNYISFSLSLSPLQNSGPCNSFHCLGHFKNVWWCPNSMPMTWKQSSQSSRHQQFTFPAAPIFHLIDGLLSTTAAHKIWQAGVLTCGSCHLEHSARPHPHCGWSCQVPKTAEITLL